MPMPPPETAPPTAPAAWAALDTALAAHLRLPAPGQPERGGPPCACGGAWRYTLLPDARRPLWRCLHCGALHRGLRALPEDAPAG